MNYCFLQDRAKEATIRFEMWPHLKTFTDLLLDPTCRLLIVGKARQLGISWTLCFYAYWKAKFSSNVKVLILSQGEDESKDMITKIKFIDNHMPAFIRARRDPDSTDFIGFPESEGEIRALPSTEKAGRSTDATLVICDEWEFHPYAENNFAALKPTIDGGGQFVAVSTADKTKLNTFFKKKYREAMGGTSNFRHLFLGALSRPGRDIEWLKQVTKDLQSWQAEGEYPLTEEEMLSSLKTRKYFDERALGDMPHLKAIDCDIAKEYRPYVRIYKLPVAGKRYAVFTDPSDGKEDPHATVVRDHTTGEWVAISHGMCPADECARIHDALVRFYNAAWNSYEYNSRAGGIFSEKMKELETPAQCPTVDPNGLLNTKGKKGWFTGKTLKEKMRLNLEEHIRLRLDTLYDKDAINELGQYIQPEGEDPQAPEGAHDDFIMAGGGVIMIDKYIPANKTQLKSFHYSERW